MTKRGLESSGVAAVDSLIALAITVGCLLPRAHLLPYFEHVSTESIQLSDAIFGAGFILAWRYCFGMLRLYSRFSTVPSRIAAILKGIVVMVSPTVLYMWEFHRSALTLHNVIVLIGALFAYEVDRIFVTDFLLDRVAARDPRRAIIVGSGRRAGKAWREIRTRYHSSMTVLGFVDDRSPEEMPPEVANRYIGPVDELEDAILKKVVDVILIAVPIKSCYQLAQRAVDIAESVGVSVVYLGDIYATNKRFSYTNESLFTELAPQQDHYVIQLLVKRLVDLVLASFLLVLLSPLMLVIALGIKLTSPGPVLFRQERYGHRRRLFTMIKFRSMVVGAEAMQQELEEFSQDRGPIIQIQDDPRVTRFGKFLRTTSLDELPQLWNVLVGEMSIVGPRPMSQRDVSRVSDASLMRRFSAKAGITGLWQVSGRSHVSFEEWIRLDNRYIDEWSLLLDIKIILQTIDVVVKRSGAI